MVVVEGVVMCGFRLIVVVLKGVLMLILGFFKVLGVIFNVFWGYF